MLKALRQVGVSPGPGHEPGPVTRAELEQFGLWQLIDGLKADSPQKSTTPSVEPQSQHSRVENQSSGSVLDSRLWTLDSFADVDDLGSESTGEDLVSCEARAEATLDALDLLANEPSADAFPGYSSPTLSDMMLPAESAAKADLDSPLAEPACEYPREYEEIAAEILRRAPPARPPALVFVGVDCDRAVAEMLHHLSEAMAKRTTGEVVIVDAGFERPRLTEHFGIDAGRTLIDVLIGATPWTDVIRPTTMPGISLLPGGRLLPADRQLLDSRQFGRLIGQLLERYCLVLIGGDSATDVDWAALANRCNNAYLVVELKRTSRQAARQAAAVLKKRGLRVLGCIAAAAGGRHG